MPVKSGRRPVPDALSPEEMAELRRWAEERVPWLSRAAFGSVRTLESYVEEVLDWGRANGRSKASWVATCRNWIRRDEFERLERLARNGTTRALGALRDPKRWREEWDAKVAATRRPEAPEGSRDDSGPGSVAVVVHAPRQGFLGGLGRRLGF